MIVSKTPLRISFFGGGSDLSAFYKHHQGMCLSTTINSYLYIALHRCVAEHCRVIYSELEQVKYADQIKHDRVRQALHFFDIKSNIEICSFSDVTHKGSGLGSSSSFTVGLVNALYKMLFHKDMNEAELAETACYIEINKCGEPIGKQDQYAAAYGGLKVYYFTESECWSRPVKVAKSTYYDLQNNLYLFDTGIKRRASDVLGVQVRNLEQETTTIALTKSLVELTKNCVIMLEHNQLDDFGSAFDAAWVIKKALASGITNPFIDEMYDIALNNGALGGKILGAGGGGYLLVYAPERDRSKLLNTMQHAGYSHMPFKFSLVGSSIEMIS